MCADSQNPCITLQPTRKHQIVPQFFHNCSCSCLASESLLSFRSEMFGAVAADRNRARRADATRFSNGGHNSDQNGTATPAVQSISTGSQYPPLGIRLSERTKEANRGGLERRLSARPIPYGACSRPRHPWHKRDGGGGRKGEGSTFVQSFYRIFEFPINFRAFAVHTSRGQKPHDEP